MKIKRLTVLAVFISLFLSVALAGCGGGGQSADSGAADGASDAGASSANSDFTIGINVKTLSNSYFREIAYGVIEGCEDLGMQWKLTTNENNTDLAGQIQNCEDLLNSGIDALVITPQSSDGIAPLIKEYNDANVPVLVVDTAANDADAAATMTMDEIQKGGDMARILADQIGGTGKIIFMPGVAGTSSSDNMQKGAEDTIKAEYPNITLVTQHADYSQEKGQQVMADLLQSNPDVRGVMALNDMMILGAVVSLQEAGYSLGSGPDDVVIACMSIDPVTADYIKDGTIFCSLYGSPQSTGYLFAGYALRAIRGEVLPEYGFIPYEAYYQDNIDSLIPDLKKVADYNFN
jgi:ABC-type sugar transport system substrate-binding protein